MNLICFAARSLKKLLALFVLVSLVPTSTNAQTATESTTPQKSIEFQPAAKLGLIESARINESSGLAPSREYPGSYWTHNDNGLQPGLFLIDSQGELQGVVQLRDAPFQDWEDIASGRIDGKNYLVLADVGDNAKRRRSYRLFIIEEPKLEINARRKPTEIRVDDYSTIEFSYPDGSKDCEAIALDTQSKKIWLITKEYFIDPTRRTRARAAIYWVAWSTRSKRKVRAKKTTEFFDPMVTGMDISSDNRLAVVRTYPYAKVFVRRDGEDWEQTFARNSNALLLLPPQPQGEAICFDLATKMLVLSSERTNQPLWKIEFKTKPNDVESNRR